MPVFVHASFDRLYTETGVISRRDGLAFGTAQYRFAGLVDIGG